MVFFLDLASRSSHSLKSALPKMSVSPAYLFNAPISRASKNVKALAPCDNHGISSATTLSNISGCSAWRVINSSLQQSDRNAGFWWRTTGYTLAVLLEKAGYSLESQYRNLLFYYFYITPELGPAPRSDGQAPLWKSFMTDNFTPLEFSWSWGYGNEPTVVRFSVEPIGILVGTSADLINEHTADRLVRQFDSVLPDHNLEWYDHFSRELVIGSQDIVGSGKIQERSQKFIAFDFEEEVLTLKAYFVPALKAATSSQTRLELIARAIVALVLRHQATIHGSCSALFDFLQTNEQSLRLEAEILGIDCVAAERSRLKIYVRSQLTSFDSVRRMMTLDGRINSSGLDKGMDELQELWRLLLWNKRHFEPSWNLPSNNHRTAGILYYFEIRPQNAHPTPKVYIPVRHYAPSDSHISSQLIEFLSKRGSYSNKENYLQAMKTAFPAPLLQTQCGAQTYVGCTIKDGRLNLISYINPGIHKYSLG